MNKSFEFSNKNRSEWRIHFLLKLQFKTFSQNEQNCSLNSKVLWNKWKNKIDFLLNLKLASENIDTHYIKILKNLIKEISIQKLRLHEYQRNDHYIDIYILIFTIKLHCKTIGMHSS